MDLNKATPTFRRKNWRERCSERHNNTMGIQIEAKLAAGAYHMAEQIDKTADKSAALILSATDVPTTSCVQLVLQRVAVC